MDHQLQEHGCQQTTSLSMITWLFHPQTFHLCCKVVLELWSLTRHTQSATHCHLRLVQYLGWMLRTMFYWQWPWFITQRRICKDICHFSFQLHHYGPIQIGMILVFQPTQMCLICLKTTLARAYVALLRRLSVTSWTQMFPIMLLGIVCETSWDIFSSDAPSPPICLSMPHRPLVLIFHQCSMRSSHATSLMTRIRCSKLCQACTPKVYLHCHLQIWINIFGTCVSSGNSFFFQPGLDSIMWNSHWKPPISPWPVQSWTLEKLHLHWHGPYTVVLALKQVLCDTFLRMHQLITVKVRHGHLSLCCRAVQKCMPCSWFYTIKWLFMVKKQLFGHNFLLNRFMWQPLSMKPKLMPRSFMRGCQHTTVQYWWFILLEC